MDPAVGRTDDGLLQRIHAAGLDLGVLLAEVDDQSRAISLRIALGALDAMADDLQRGALARQSSVGVISD
ncbi:hypothetical protein E1212_21435 [Jiangella ureilytica]|uniref:Resolvase/invertase-type recombinase catalytic domain-containing protein n=1 Tax=Jiangella ureilytica TaxID=2530374 RepID=A0A4R4RG51_9ACTN|nr:hypothetical protein [Jiangella ureilytica]TDC48371.1 hypothetical protein E1212_21435 [Jiangella ureilytica]